MDLGEGTVAGGAGFVLLLVALGLTVAGIETIAGNITDRC